MPILPDPARLDAESTNQIRLVEETAHEQAAIPDLCGPCDNPRVTGWRWNGGEHYLAASRLRLVTPSPVASY